ncbi:hypothetical protein B0H63DRAFT_318612 [Podospora didyma]|uniref:Uncharacterized protein n=1 Tax=Podospora didyma TaxID=330526 RepID=A0AAE0K6P2_9PEZI|nr:hypothetical protein B0H63DRAFT_318612 [Podospora didyma]
MDGIPPVPAAMNRLPFEIVSAIFGYFTPELPPFKCPLFTPRLSLRKKQRQCNEKEIEGSWESDFFMRRKTLRSARAVSVQFYAVATPIFLQSVVLYDEEGVLCFLRFLHENPDHAKYIRNMAILVDFTSDAVGSKLMGILLDSQSSFTVAPHLVPQAKRPPPPPQQFITLSDTFDELPQQQLAKRPHNRPRTKIQSVDDICHDTFSHLEADLEQSYRDLRFRSSALDFSQMLFHFILQRAVALERLMLLVPGFLHNAPGPGSWLCLKHLHHAHEVARQADPSRPRLSDKLEELLLLHDHREVSSQELTDFSEHIKRGTSHVMLSNAEWTREPNRSRFELEVQRNLVDTLPALRVLQFFGSSSPLSRTEFMRMFMNPR